MRDQASPITADERRGRIEKARRLMAERKIDALMLTGGTSLVYFSGMRWGLSERLFAMVLPVKGDAFYVCPAFEEDRAREQIAKRPARRLGRRAHLGRAREPVRSAWRRDCAIAGSPRAGSGIEETVRFVFSDGVSQAAPAVKITSGTPVTAGCRIVKDAARAGADAARVASDAQGLRGRVEGAQGRHDAGRLRRSRRASPIASSASKATPACRSVEYSALPHGSLTPQVVREGSILLIDGGCSVEGYASDLSRTFVLGKPTDKMKQVFEIEYRAQTAALKAARPGVPCEAVDAAARKVIVDAGYGPDYKYFTHRVGHGMGMDGHEWPYLVKGNTLPLAPGHDLQRRTRDLHPRGVRRPAGRRHGDHGERRRADDAAEPIARQPVRAAAHLRQVTGLTGLHAGHQRPHLRDVDLLDRHRRAGRPARGTPAGRGRP